MQNPTELRHPVAGTLVAFLAALGFSVALFSQTASALTITLLGGGESSPPSGYHRVEQGNSAVTYGGNWNTENSTLTQTFSGGTAATSLAAGAQASFRFSGTAVRWVGYRDAWSGIADVYIDGTLQSTVDTYSLTPDSEALIFSASGLTAATHTLSIHVKGTHSLLALGSSVWVDAFDYKPLPPDTTSPTVALTAPTNGSTVSGTLTVSANASDNVGVVGVQFMLDGANLGSEDKAAPYAISWNTTTTGNGSHTLDAVAWDAAGNKTTSATVTVTVSNNSGDTTPPAVNMTAPANGATVSGSVTVSANASDNVGVAGVQFKLDGANLGAEDTSAPYSISWDTTGASNGSHTLTAVARDAAGNKTTSSPVAVTVSNSSGDTTPPTVTMTAPANGATVSGSVTVSANASDNVAVAGVQFQLNGANLGAEVTATPYTITWDATTVANGSYTLDAVARDSSGNRTTSASVTVTVSNSSGGAPTRVEETDPSVTYTGTWSQGDTSRSWSGGTAALSTTAASRATITFTGTQINWIGFRGPQAGIANVYVDGTLVATVDAYATAEQIQAVMYTSATLTQGSHTLAVEVTGNMNSAASNDYVVVDAFDVTGGGGSGGNTPTVSMTAPANGATVSGTVTVSANASESGGSIASVQFKLDGANLGAPVTASPYRVSWDTTTAANGSHSLTAVANDATGKSTTASPVTVTVSNSSGGGGGTTTRIEQDNAAVTYAGTWVTASESDLSGGTADESYQAGSSATLTFTGTGVTWISYLCACTAGISNVFLDGAQVAQVDTYSATRQAQAAVYSVRNLAPGTHTLRIEVTGNYDPAGNSAYVVVDAFDVTN